MLFFFSFKVFNALVEGEIARVWKFSKRPLFASSLCFGDGCLIWSFDGLS